MNLYLDRKGSSLDIQGRQLIIRRGEQPRQGIPLLSLQRLVISASTQLNSRVIGALAEHGVELVVLNPRHAQRNAWLLGNAHNQVSLRMQQYMALHDPDWQLSMAQRLVHAKLLSQLRGLHRFMRQRPDQRHRLFKSKTTLAQQLATLPASTEKAQILGLEGAAASAYFQALGAMFPAALGFHGRNRRPPQDPVNACLSLGYTLLHGLAVYQCHRSGLDPMAGALHEPAFGRDSLACDLIEPLRVHVDRWVQQLFSQRTLRAEHFSMDKGACLLGKTGRQHFYQAWEQQANRPLRRQLRRYTRWLLHRITDYTADHEHRPLTAP